jgi:hypothetical protein
MLPQSVKSWTIGAVRRVRDPFAFQIAKEETVRGVVLNCPSIRL